MTTFDDAHGQDELDELDLLASLYVDGEATPEERARVEANPAARERVAEFMLLQDAVSAPVDPVDEATRERAIAAALAHAPAPPIAAVEPPTQSPHDHAVQAGAEGTTPVPVAPPPAPGNVRSMDAQRAKRAERRTRFLQAAAALAMIGVGGAVIFNLNSRAGTNAMETASFDTAAEESADVVRAPASGSEALAVPVPELRADDEALDADEAMEDDFSDAMEEASEDASVFEEEAAMEEAFEEAEMAEEPEAEEAPLPQESASQAEAGADGDAERSFALDDVAGQQLEFTEQWVKADNIPEPGFAERTDFLGEFQSVEDLAVAIASLRGEALDPVLEPLSGNNCPEMWDVRDSDRAVIVATAALATTDPPGEIIVVQRADGSFDAHDRLTCETPISGLR